MTKEKDQLDELLESVDLLHGDPSAKSIVPLAEVYGM